jgi:single-stranded DNA-binding protein
MANVTVSGVVTGRPGEHPVVLKTFDSGETVASFSIADLEYVYAKKDTERQGQFYRVEVRGKAAEIANDRISRGMFVSASGQLVQRTYNEKIYLDVKNARLTLPSMKDSDRSSASAEDVPF